MSQPSFTFYMKRLLKLVWLSTASTVIHPLAAFQGGYAQEIKFEPELQQSWSLSHNHVASISEDSEALWIGTDAGLFKKDNPYAPPIVFTGFRKFNQPAKLDTAISEWFIALGVLLLGLMIHRGYRWWLHRLKAREEELERTVMARTEQLRESEERFRSAFMHAMTGMSRTALDGRLLQVNPALCKIWGYDEAELLATNFQALTHPDDLNANLELLQQALASGAPSYHMEKRYIHKDGRTISALLNVGIVRDPQGKPLFLISHAHDITERKRAEEALKQSEELFRMLYNNTPVMMQSINKNGELVNVNDYWLKVMGYKREEVLGKKSVDFVTAASREYAENVNIPKFFKTGWLENIEYQWIKKSGEIIDVLLSSVGIRDERGEVERSLAFIVDVTERKRAVQALRESELKFRTLAESITAGAFIFHGTKIRYVNSAAIRISGYTREELLAMDFWEVVHPECRNMVKERGMARQRGEAVPSRYEVKLLTKQGETRWIDFTATLIEFEGQPAVLGTALDITQRMQTEQALRQSEERYRSLVEQMPDGLYRSTPDGKFIAVNAAMVKMFGYESKEELLSIDIPRQLYFDPSDREKAVALVKQKGNQAIIPVRHRRKDGEEIWSEAHTRLICDDSGNVIYHEGILRDITARKRLEEQLRLHTENLEKLVETRTAQIRELEKQRIETEKLAAIGRMAARIAHEVNNPLGSIQTAFHLISRAVPIEHRHHHYVDKIEKEIERISRIMRQMLELHKPHIETPTALRPDVTIEEILVLLRPQFLERHVDFKPDLERARRMITLPENMLRQILYNVILNAQEASPPNGLVFITAQTGEQNLEITVADQGEGIPEEIKAQIFEPFFTTKSSGNTGGMGLGLSICKSLVEAMNGAITFDSKPGEGTICRITMPLNQSKVLSTEKNHE